MYSIAMDPDTSQFIPPDAARVLFMTLAAHSYTIGLVDENDVMLWPCISYDHETRGDVGVCWYLRQLRTDESGIAHAVLFAGPDIEIRYKLEYQIAIYPTEIVFLTWGFEFMRQDDGSLIAISVNPLDMGIALDAGNR